MSISSVNFLQEIPLPPFDLLYGPETETGRIFYSPPRPDQKKLLTASTRSELNLSFAPRPASTRKKILLAPPLHGLSFTFAPRPDSRRYIYFSKI